MSNLIQKSHWAGNRHSSLWIVWGSKAGRLWGEKGPQTAAKGPGEDGWPGPPRAQDNAAPPLVWELQSGVFSHSQAAPLGRATKAEICTHGFHMPKRRNFDPQLPPPCRNACALAAWHPQPLFSLRNFRLKDFFQIWPSTNMLVHCFRDTHSQRSKPKGDFVIGHTISFIVQLPWNRSPSHWNVQTPKSRNSPCKLGPWLWSYYLGYCGRPGY